MGNLNDAPTNACPLGNDKCNIGSTIANMQSEIDELKAQVNIDPLTGLFNTRHMRFTLAQEMERSRRTNTPTTFILIDADHFKRINDTHGHVAGDHALMHLANIVRANVRRIDIPCRYGGEEFSVILPSTPKLVGVQVAERIRADIEQQPLIYQDTTIPITISAGVTTFHYTSDSSVESLMEDADKLLYVAKENGRNQVQQSDEKIGKDAVVSQDEKDALMALSSIEDDSFEDDSFEDKESTSEKSNNEH